MTAGFDRSCSLPPSPDGEWWEMTDESTGVPYYYHTKTGETVWERPQAFVIPLGVLQVCSTLVSQCHRTHESLG